MRRSLTILISVTASVAMSSSISAEPLEVGLSVAPTTLQDHNFEAFSENDLVSIPFGIAVRFEIAEPGGFKILPFVGYRFAYDRGNPYYILDTKLLAHDFDAGFRVRKGVLSWMAVFLEAFGGVLWADMSGTPDDDYDFQYGDLGARQDYEDDRITWSVGGIGGVEMYMSKSWLRSRNICKFDFAGEIAGGYVRRGDMTFEPGLESGIDNALDAETRPWGDINLSGWIIQAGVSFLFF
jgi:hypothetical protein